MDLNATAAWSTPRNTEIQLLSEQGAANVNVDTNNEGIVPQEVSAMRSTALQWRSQPCFVVIRVIIHYLVNVSLVSFSDPWAVCQYCTPNQMDLHSMLRNSGQSIASVAITEDWACYSGQKDNGHWCSIATWCPCECTTPVTIVPEPIAWPLLAAS